MTQAEPTSRIIDLCLDANDPLRQAHFWAAALGWELGESEVEFALLPTDDTKFGILFEPIAAQKRGQNNIHLDLTTTSIEDQNALVERLIGLGASHVDVGQSGDEGHVVLSDPEGNEFCIIEPDNNFTAGCGRLGVINADGTRKVGQFWSEALGWPPVWDQDEETAIRAPAIREEFWWSSEQRLGLRRLGSAPLRHVLSPSPFKIVGRPGNGEIGAM